jgi:SAM-dependent methyltransferase
MLRKLFGKRPVGGSASSGAKTVSTYTFDRIDYAPAAEVNLAKPKILNLLNYTKTSGTSYSGSGFPAGYHEIRINGETFAGQRKPYARLEKTGIDFSGKTVLDIGCNQGGMVFALADKVKWAVGLDYDYRMVNACNAIRSCFSVDNTNFYVFDIDRDPHDMIRDFLPGYEVDLVFLLSVCMWVDRWREIIDYAASISGQMLFESNGTDAQQEEQLAHLHHVYGDVALLAGHSDDDPGQKKRALYLCRGSREPLSGPE